MLNPVFRSQFLYFVIFLFTMAGCLDPYEPPRTGGESNLLVVDGFINVSNQSASVTLSKALPLDTTAVPEFIDNAQVTIEHENGQAFPLSNIAKGQYSVSSVAWNMDGQYRLHVALSSGETYLSDYITLTRTPDIDSVTFGEGKDALNIYVNTHEPSGDARYYKWEYDETWEYTASFFSTYKLVNGEAFTRDTNELIYYCWDGSASTRVLVGNTLKLSEDVVTNFPITAVPAGSEKISRRYSINVKQRTLTEDEFEFWTQLRKTTEDLGGLFDPLPYAVVGNIHGTNNTDVVLGYFGGGEVKEQRLFVNLHELPRNVLEQSLRTPCQPDDIRPVFLADLATVSSQTTVLIDAIYARGIGIVGYTYSFPSCADCRTQGGTTTKPDFW